jgi:hypothetical protein
MSSTVERKQSRKVREFLAKKKEKEIAQRDNILSIFQNPKKDNNKTTQITLKALYDITIDKCAGFLSSGITKEILKTINILKKLLADGHDIDYIIVRLLCHGNLLFFQFVRQVRKDLLNHFEAYDEVVRACKPYEIIELLKFGVLEIEHAMKINKMESLEATIYMFIQLTDYENTIQEYLWQTYSSILSKQGLLRHMILRNVPHEIAVYLKSLNSDEFNETLVNFPKVLKSYEVLEETYKGSPILKGRLINLIRMIVDMVFNQGLILPSMTEFLEYFKKVYIMKDYADIPMFLQILPWDAHWHISMKILQLNVEKLFPYDTPDGKWA